MSECRFGSPPQPQELPVMLDTTHTAKDVRSVYTARPLQHDSAGARLADPTGRPTGRATRLRILSLLSVPWRRRGCSGVDFVGLIYSVPADLVDLELTRLTRPCAGRKQTSTNDCIASSKGVWPHATGHVSRGLSFPTTFPPSRNRTHPATHPSVRNPHVQYRGAR